MSCEVYRILHVAKSFPNVLHRRGSITTECCRKDNTKSNFFYVSYLALDKKRILQYNCLSEVDNQVKKIIYTEI